MTRSKQELQELARQMDQGMYVTKGTLYGTCETHDREAALSERNV